jgi:predicted dehydrogenase
MTTKLRVAVAGCGGISRAMHLPAWRELVGEGRVELVAVCDIMEDRVKAIAAEFGAARSYTDFEKMIKDEQIDILDVCTQNRLHAPMTLVGLEAGAHVLVEKPMAMNSAEARAMVDMAEKHGRTLMVAQHMRFDPINEMLKGIVDGGELGRVYTGRAQWMRRRGIPGWGRFHIKSESLGGPLIDIGVHMLDLTLWMLNYPKPLAVSGKVYRMFGDRDDLYNGPWGRAYQPNEFDVEDYATALIRLENDITVSLEVSWAANIQSEVLGFSILGDKAGISSNPPAMFGYRQGALTTTKFEEIIPSQAHRAEIRHFTTCLEQNLPVRVQPSQSLQLQQIIDGIYQSSDAGAEVRLDA